MYVPIITQSMLKIKIIVVVAFIFVV